MKVGGIDVSSLSARRAWIEIAGTMATSRGTNVALRKESVDRNKYGVIPYFATLGRSPQGERG